ncbi:hypothetical protein GCM10020227_14350 [Streptomyces flavovirens]
MAVATVGGVAAALALAEATLLGFHLSYAVARNFLGYLGVGLLVQRFTHAQYSAITVAAIPVFCGLVGLAPGGRPYPWMWPAHINGSAVAASTAIFLFAIGVLATLKHRNRS